MQSKKEIQEMIQNFKSKDNTLPEELKENVVTVLNWVLETEESGGSLIDDLGY